MAILSRDEFFARLHDRIGEDSSDDTITFLEDMTDTYNDLERRARGDGEDWEKRYRDLDEAWKRRYRHRFFSGGDRAEEFKETDETEILDPEDVSVDDLFEERRD